MLFPQASFKDTASITIPQLEKLIRTIRSTW
jgi:hypothetical protein